MLLLWNCALYYVYDTLSLPICFYGKFKQAELERKINALTKSKIHYKQQYGRCLKELARLKQAMQAEAQVQLQKQQQELEQMKLQLIASEQKESIKGHQQMLHEIKEDLQRLDSHCNKDR